MAADRTAAIAGRVYVYLNLIAAAAIRHTVAPGMIAAVIHLESQGDPDRFEAGTADVAPRFGLMQLPLHVVRGLGYSGPVRMLFDLYLNIELGTQYLAVLLNRYDDPLLALICYYGGAGAVRWYKAGWTRGRASAYAKSAIALQHYYERLEKAAPANG